MGRPKLKNRERYSNGRVKPGPPPARLLRIMQGVATDKWVIAMGTSVTRLSIVEQYLTAQEADAAALYAQAKLAWEQALGIPSQNPRAQDLNAVHGHSEGFDEATARRMRAKYDVYYSGLSAGEIEILDRHIVRDIWPGWWERPELKKTLGKIVTMRA